jgi:RNA polymerase sigma-54 factor
MMKVATEIVRRQRNFLEYGEEAMKPLVLARHRRGGGNARIHDLPGDHAQVHAHAPGHLRAQVFFSSHVSTTAGGACSSTAIRALIRKLIAAENPRKPLSDSKLAQLLEDQGIQVARRTIAKYRDSLFIPPSNERKRLV